MSLRILSRLLKIDLTSESDVLYVIRMYQGIGDVDQLNSVDGATYQSLYCPNTEWGSLG